MSTENLVTEMQLKLLSERVLSTGEPYICVYVTSLLSFLKCTLSIPWYIAQNLLAYLFHVLLSFFCKTGIFNRFLKVATATSNFMNKVNKGGFAPEFSVSMLKEIDTLFRNYVCGTRNWKGKLATKCMWIWKWNLLPIKY